MPLNKPVHLGLSILELSKTLMYEFWYDNVKSKYLEKQNCVTWLYEYIKQMIFIKTLQKMLKLDLILQIMNYIDYYLNEIIKKSLEEENMN